MGYSSSGVPEELKSLRENLLEMTSRIEEDLGKAVEALRGGDIELAEWVKEDDKTVNFMQFSIQDRAAQFLAARQPVGRDLRELVSVIRMADNLERMGDYAVHLAKTVMKVRNLIWERQFEILGKMGEFGCIMLQKMITSWIDMDIEAADACARMDSHIDDLHDTLVSMTVDDMSSDSRISKEAVALIRTSGYLERFGDQVTNACELVVYTVTGRHYDLNV